MNKKNKLAILYLFQGVGDLFIFTSVVVTSYLINLHYEKSPLNALWAALFMGLWIYSKYTIKEIEKEENQK